MQDEPDSQAITPPTGVLDRGLLLLHLFTMQRNRMFLRELSELSSLDKATTLRALRSLVEWGFLERHPDGSYSPGAMNLRLAAIFKETSTITMRVEQPLNVISERTGKAVSFFVLAGDQRICLCRSRKQSTHTSYVELGTSIPVAHGGSAAKILLAYGGPPDAEMDEIRARGYATSSGERLRHFSSVSLPLFEVDGTFLGAVTVAGLSAVFDGDDFPNIAQIATEELNRLGFSRMPNR